MVKIKYAIDTAKMDNNQLDIYYAMMESLGHFRLGIEQLEQTDASNWMIRELNDLLGQMETTISEAVPGEGGTTIDTILTVIKPVEDYIFNISASLQNMDYYSMQAVQNALNTMYTALGSLKSMTNTYYPKESTSPATSEESTPEITEDDQVLEQKKDEVKNIIDSTINSEVTQEEKKKTIDSNLNEIAYTAVYNTLKKLKSYGYTDLAVNEEARQECFNSVYSAFLEIVKESALRNYLNKETLVADARYVSNYFFDQLANTVVEWG